MEGQFHSLIRDSFEDSVYLRFTECYGRMPHGKRNGRSSGRVLSEDCSPFAESCSGILGPLFSHVVCASLKVAMPGVLPSSWAEKKVEKGSWLGSQGHEGT